MNINEQYFLTQSIYNPKIIWYNKTDVLSIFPITERTYFRRIKNLPDDIRTQIKKNKKGKPSLCIHYQDLSKVFQLKRKPNDITNTLIKRKFIGTKKWDYIGNIVPKGANLKDIQFKMNFVFEKLKSQDESLEIFYSCEANKNDNNVHSHFLLKSALKKNQITEILELICDVNDKEETRIYLERYDFATFHYSGSFYSFKNADKDKSSSIYDEYLF
jgi:hypothetical protein